MKFIKFPKFKFTKFTPQIIGILVLALFVTGLLAYFIWSTLPFLPESIPFFYNLSWGESQLSPNYYIWGFIIINLLIIIINTFFIIRIYKKKFYLLSVLVSIATALLVALNSFYAYKIISTTIVINLYVPGWVKLSIIPILLAFITTLIVTPLVIKFANRFNLIDDPLRHKHPGMLLTKPTPRAGGLAFYLGLIIPAILILPITSSQKIIGILLGALINVVVGLFDDRKDVNPYIRLGLQVAAVLIAVLSGIILIYIPNPFGNSFVLDNYKFTFEFMGPHTVYYYSVIAAAIWIMWTMNFMSFANGSDGVYAGLITIAAAVITIVMLMTLQDDPSMAIFIKLAALTTGAALGMALFTWPPQKLLWGYGSTAAGLIIASLSIIGSTKVAITLIVLIIPFLDGAFAVIRRLRRGQSPFWGDREHLHHKLLEGYGWSKQRVALFYWSSTLVFAVIGIFTSGQIRAISLIALGSIALLGIALVNFFKKPKEKSLSE